MRRSVPISEYPMEQLKEAITNKNADNTEEDKQQNELIAQFVEDEERKINKENVEQKTSHQLEKRYF